MQTCSRHINYNVYLQTITWTSAHFQNIVNKYKFVLFRFSVKILGQGLGIPSYINPLYHFLLYNAKLFVFAVWISTVIMHQFEAVAGWIQRLHVKVLNVVIRQISVK